MYVFGWKTQAPNVKTGAGYGIRLNLNDRDKFFNRNWDFVRIELDKGKIIKVNLSNSFWRDCIELRSKWIGKWMVEKVVAPWPKFNPPKLRLEPIKERIFKLSIS